MPDSKATPSNEEYHLAIAPCKAYNSFIIFVFTIVFAEGFFVVVNVSLQLM